eukprot:67158-Rhodomonas_salina.2
MRVGITTRGVPQSLRCVPRLGCGCVLRFNRMRLCFEIGMRLCAEIQGGMKADGTCPKLARSCNLSGS